MKKLVSLLALLLLVIVLGGCATVRGMGQDFESLGKGINKTVSGD
ncbi:MAG: entericidin EcnA/B family protein [Candidatus Methylomirabilales bacterium]